MGNTQSNGDCALAALVPEFAARVSAGDVSPSSTSGSPRAILELPTFTSKVDYADSGLLALLPASCDGAKVTCLMTSTSLAAVAKRRAQMERGAQLLRTSHHPNLFRCVLTNENAVKQFSMIGAPQIEWLVHPATLKDSLDMWSAGEILHGLAAVVEAVAALTASHGLVPTELRLHQISVAKYTTHQTSGGSTLSSSGGPGLGIGCGIDAALIHDGRWIIHDVSTFEPRTAHDSSAIPWGTTLRTVALLVLEILGRMICHDTLATEFLSTLRRSVSSENTHTPTTDSSSGTAKSVAEDTHATDTSSAFSSAEVSGKTSPPPADVHRQLSGTLDFVDGSPGGGTGGVSGAGSSSAAQSGARMAALRTVEFAFEQLLEDMRAVVAAEPQHAASVVAPTAEATVSEVGEPVATTKTPPSPRPEVRLGTATGSDSGRSSSSTPVRRGATPAGGSLPSFDAALYSCSAEALVHWLQVALFDAVHIVHSSDEVERALRQLRRLLEFGLRDPLCTMLHHGALLYLYESEDERTRQDGSRLAASPTTYPAARERGANLKLEAYEVLLKALKDIHQERELNGAQRSGADAVGLSGSFHSNAATTAAGGGQRRNAVPAATVWERRVFPWLMHPSQVAQREAARIFDYVFETLDTPRSLLSRRQLEAVAHRWLWECRNPVCRASALRYAKWLLPALPSARRAAYVTTTAFTLMQGRVWLEALTDAASGKQNATVRSPDSCRIAIQCTEAYVRVIPTLMEELLVRSTSCVVDRDSCRRLLRDVLLKELLLLVRGGCEALCDDVIGWSGSVHQATFRLCRQIIVTLGELATPYLKRAAAFADAMPGGVGGVPAPVATWLSALTHCVYYGSTDSRERFLSLMSAMFFSRSTTGLDETGVSIPLPRSTILRWWLPLTSPLTASRDVGIRVAACNVAMSLVESLRNVVRSSESVDALAKELPTFYEVVQAEGSDVAMTHPHGYAVPGAFIDGTTSAVTASGSPGASGVGSGAEVAAHAHFAQQYRRVYAVCYQECATKTLHAAQQATGQIAMTPVPSKDFLGTAEGRAAMWSFCSTKIDLDHVLLPQPWVV